jgi:SET domain-containing protein
VNIEKYRTIEPQYPSYIDRNHYGLCLRAARDLKKGTVVATADFEKTDKPYIADHSSDEHKYVALVAVSIDDVPTWGKVRGKWAFCNHSCDPNCDISDTFQIITNRDVQNGQELTTSYDAFVPNFPWQENWNFICLCEAKNCKKIIKEYRMDIVYPINKLKL